MSQAIKLVQNDTGPPLYFSITDQTTGLPVDISGASAINLLFYPYGSGGTDVGALTLALTAITGIVNADGSITTTAPYNVAGVGGRCVLPSFPIGALAVAQQYQGEIQITISGVKQTVYDQLTFTVRPL